MESITIEKLIEKLKIIERNFIIVKMEGNIEQEIKITLEKVKKEEDFIVLIYKTNEYKKLKINLHQIKKIESYKDLEFYIYLDGGQKIIIIVNKEKYKKHNFFEIVDIEQKGHD